MIKAIGIALSGLTAASKKVEAGASNIANLNTVGSLEDGKQAPYSALTTKQTAQAGGGVSSEIVPKNQPFVPAFDPDSPFADENGVIGVPNVNLAEEAVGLNVAELTFKANAATLRAAEDLSNELFRIFDEEV